MSTLVASGIIWVGPGTMDAAPEPTLVDDATDAMGPAGGGVVTEGEMGAGGIGVTVGTNVDGPGVTGLMFNAGSTPSAMTMRIAMPITAPMMIFVLPGIPLPGTEGFTGKTDFGISTPAGFSAEYGDEPDEGGGDGWTAFFPDGGIYHDGFSTSSFCPTGSGSARVTGAGSTKTEGFNDCIGDGGGTGIAGGATVT
jgi:hypothetical protein